MISPVTYQGGKSRLAAQIVTKMEIPSEAIFYDLCCGSGAVALAAAQAGHPVNRIVMVEQGPWGLFWKAIGEGAFDVNLFGTYCKLVPEDPRKIKAFMEELYRQPPGERAAYIYLLLQAAAIGGKSISLINGAWIRGSGFRDYWLPTETSSRRSPVNPMMPMPKTIYSRVVEIAAKMRSIRGVCGDAAQTVVEPGSVVYIDPPYVATTGYGYSIDVIAVAKIAAARGATVWVSEGRPLTDKAICLSAGRMKGGITGDRKCAANEEWLSCFTEEMP